MPLCIGNFWPSCVHRLRFVCCVQAAGLSDWLSPVQLQQSWSLSPGLPGQQQGEATCYTQTGIVLPGGALCSKESCSSFLAPSSSPSPLFSGCTSTQDLLEMSCNMSFSSREILFAMETRAQLLAFCLCSEK